MNVFIGKDFDKLFEKSSPECVSGIFGWVNWAIIPIGFALGVALRQDWHGISPWLSVPYKVNIISSDIELEEKTFKLSNSTTRRIEFSHDSDSTLSCKFNYFANIWTSIDMSVWIICALFCSIPFRWWLHLIQIEKTCSVFLLTKLLRSGKVALWNGNDWSSTICQWKTFILFAAIASCFN